MNVKEDLCRTFALTRQNLRLLGIWPDPDISLSDFRRPKLRCIIVMCIISIYVFMPQLLNTIRSWGNVSLMVQHISVVNYCILAFFNLSVTWYHGKSLRTLIKLITVDWTTAKETWKRNTMLKFARRGRNLSYGTYMCSMISALFYLLSNLLKLYRNLHQPVGQRKFIYQITYSYNIKKSPTYEITYLIQIFGGLSTAVINVTTDCFIGILLLHISAQLINLRMMLNILVKKLVEKSISFSTFKKELAAIVVRHENLIRRTERINNCYSTEALIYMIATTFHMCLQTFQLFMIISSEGKNISIMQIGFRALYLTGQLLRLYIHCYSSEQLMAESTNMAYGVYECQWYDLPSKNAQDLMFIVYQSRIPLKMRAGKFAIFSMEMFGTLVKTSMGYLSMLLTIRN
ncbi:odorant receptor 4-like [Odontomachus brunneus]|uniref:odorant receptor 4-like n=1 Tax=Odontomachus brunneus TaxID=486640 RepID=UPI0013F1B317|nr:odorant receptor 4-like [Odontomachus brunneus]